MKKVRVAILGACGWMGKCHSLGYRNLPLLYPEYGVQADIRWLIDEARDKVTALEAAYPGARSSTNGRMR